MLILCGVLNSLVQFLNQSAALLLTSSMIFNAMPIASTNSSHFCRALNSALFMYLKFLICKAPFLKVCPFLNYSRRGFSPCVSLLRPSTSRPAANAHRKKRMCGSGAASAEKTALSFLSTATVPRKRQKTKEGRVSFFSCENFSVKGGAFRVGAFTECCTVKQLNSAKRLRANGFIRLLIKRLLRAFNGVQKGCCGVAIGKVLPMCFKSRKTLLWVALRRVSEYRTQRSEYGTERGEAALNL